MQNIIVKIYFYIYMNLVVSNYIYIFLSKKMFCDFNIN